jgi:hypothetical protein
MARVGAANDLQARYWTTRYPSAALVEMMRLVQLARRQLTTGTGEQCAAGVLAGR